ncbi:hypothetical protein T06_15686 [Trichinella sp. T6]|nr:hypothetical protein T06_15686 [Trichinella sp. T6]
MQDEAETDNSILLIRDFNQMTSNRPFDLACFIAELRIRVSTRKRKKIRLGWYVLKMFPDIHYSFA